MTWDDVARIALALPEVEVGTAYGTPALRVRKAFMCRLREDGETLAIRCDFDERPMLMDANPGVLFITSHYQTSPFVLVSLPRVGEDLLRELIEDVWIERAPKKLVAAFLAERTL